MCSQQISVLHSINHSLTSKIYFTEVNHIFSFQKISHLQKPYVCWCDWTQRILIEHKEYWKQSAKDINTHTTKSDRRHYTWLISVKISYRPLLKNNPLFQQPFPCNEKNLNPPPFFFWWGDGGRGEFQKLDLPPPFIKREELQQCKVSFRYQNTSISDW